MRLMSAAQPAEKRGFLRRLMLLSFLCAFLFQLLLSKNSPLYPTNDWVDANCFFTVGESLLRGKVLYRDIYEQKGPVLYFVFALAAMISDTSFIGVFLIYILSMTLFLFFGARIVHKMCRDEHFSYISVVLLAMITNACYAFSHGGGSEELLLWTLAASLYIITNSVLENRLFTRGECFSAGLFAALALFVKFTVLGFYLGMVLYVLVKYLKEKRFTQLFGSIGFFLLGLVPVFVPVFLYFFANDALGDLFTAYFYNNIFLYDHPMAAKIPMPFSRIITIFHGLGTSILQNPVNMLLIGAGFWRLFRRKDGMRPLFHAMISPFVFLVVGSFWGRYYQYYSLPLTSFTVLGFAVLREKLSFRFRAALPATLAACLVISLIFSQNTSLLFREKRTLPSYRFAETIKETPNATLLQYGSLDGGFYHAADITPSCKFFCGLNIELPELKETQNEVIESAGVDFVVTRDQALDCPQYTCIDTASYVFEKKEVTYFLHRRTADIK